MKRRCWFSGWRSRNVPVSSCAQSDLSEVARSEQLIFIFVIDRARILNSELSSHRFAQAAPPARLAKRGMAGANLFRPRYNRRVSVPGKIQPGSSLDAPRHQRGQHRLAFPMKAGFVRLTVSLCPTPA
jgi:hypothetical protein